MTIHTDSVWDQVRLHPWKYRPRTQPIAGILWHCTRGGQWYDGATELGAFLNWVRSPNNRIPFPGGDYAGIASYGIGPGKIVEVVPPDAFVPAWSSWPSDEGAVSVEVAQSNPGQPIEAATIAECVRFAKYQRDTRGIPLIRAYPTDDRTWTGMAGHEDTVQGQSQGKSDPGPEFWAPFLAALAEEDDMTPEERKMLADIHAALTGGMPGVLEAWNENGNSLLVGYTQIIYPAVARLDEHLANHAAGVTGQIPEHTHEGGKVKRP